MLTVTVIYTIFFPPRLSLIEEQTNEIPVLIVELTKQKQNTPLSLKVRYM